MKIGLSIILVLGFAMLAAGQAAAPVITTTQNRYEVVNGGFILSGAVKLRVIGPVDIEADVAEVDETTREMTLRGNVKVKLPPTVALP